MSDVHKTNAQLIQELASLRALLEQLEERHSDSKRAEAAHLESEERYRTLVETIPYGVQEIDTHGKILFGSSPYHKMLGWPEGELHGKHIVDLLPGEEENHFLPGYLATLVKEQPPPTPYLSKNRTKDGRIIDIQVDWNYKRNRHGELTGFISVISDITERQHTEAALRESEQQFRALAQTVAAATFIFQDERIVYANPTAEVISGYSQDELLQMNFWDVIHPDFRDLVRSRGLARRKDDAVPTHYEVQISTKDAQVRWVDFTAGMIEFDGRPAVLGTAFDITERKRVEHALRESERRFRAIFDQTYQFIGLMTPDGTLIEANRSALNFAGIEASDVLGKPFWETPWWIHSAELQERLRAAVRDAAAGHFVRFESSHLAPDGSLHHIDFSLKPVMDESGNVALLIPEGRDITERKKAEDELRLFKTISDRAPYGCGITDLDGILLYVNDAFARMHDWPAHEVVGRHLSVFHTEDQMSIVDRLNERMKGEGSFVNEEVWHKKRDGTTFPTLMNATLIKDDDGKPLFLSAAAVDITDQKQAERERARLEEQLRHSQKMEAVGTLSSGIAHEFNNLLTAIFGYTDLAKTTLDDDHPAIRALEMVEESATQARGVTNSLLTFSHKKVSRKEPIDLVQTVRVTTSLLRRVLPASTELVEDLPEGRELWVNADAAQIQQILMNLAVNARDAMPEGGHLRIALQEVHCDDAEPGRAPAPHGSARLLVEDDGTGMTEDVRSRVFEPFFTTKPKGQGTGLGLSVIHGIVNDHDGRIELDSSPGQGTRIAILLPCCPPPEAPQTPPPKRPHVKGHGEVILVVEDNELVRSIMTSALRSWGYQVLPATDGAQAVKTLHAHRETVRLVVLDLDMPEANGLSILNETRREHADLPIIVVTGTVGIHPEEHLRASDALLRKPFQMSDLTALVARSLAGPRRKKGGE